MTSPNFRPGDVKVGSRIRCSDGVVREVESIESQLWCIFSDRCGMFINGYFPESTENSAEKGKNRTALFLGQELVSDSVAISGGKVVTDTDIRLTAIEERLPKLEKQWIDGMEGTVDTKTTKQPQSPKVCPVSGMFLEEPEIGKYFSHINLHGDIITVQWLKNDLAKFTHGNCFATREDAERYAKHLKAMAKLRRLGGISKPTRHTRLDGSVYIQHEWYITKACERGMTPKEKNALMWPNEEK